MTWALIDETEVSGGQSILLSPTITAPVLVIEASTKDSAGEETVPGYARAIASFSDDADPFESVDFDRVSISLVHPQLFEVTQRFVTSYKIQLVLYAFVAFPVTVKVWAIEGVELPLAGDSGDRSNRDQQNTSLIDFVPMPSAAGIAIGPGLAVFTAGQTMFQLPTETQPDYHQQYSVRGDAFWQIGARSLEPFSSGRVRFGSGSGRSVLGLAPQFTTVNFRLVPWSWYIHSPSEVRPMDRVDGAVKSRGAFDWSPDKELALRVEEGRVVYEIQEGEGWEAVYESPHLVTEPLYFCVVLGPQAFVFNCSFY